MNPVPTISVTDLFQNPNPEPLRRPHLITTLDGDLIGKVSQLTKSRPGLWPLPAPFNEDDQYNEVREEAPFADWGLPLNQVEVQAVGRLIKDALFGTNLMLVDARVDEQRLTPLAQTKGMRLANGAWFTPGYQDLPNLNEIVDLAGWVLIPIGIGRSRALFSTSTANAHWIGELEEWCNRQGRDTWTLTAPSAPAPVSGGLALNHSPAPSPQRDNALAHRVDSFLGDIELWFGSDLDQGHLPELVRQRLAHRRELKTQIDRVRPPLGGSNSGPAPDAGPAKTT